MLDSRVKLTKDRKSMEIWVDVNTNSRSCGESRSDWELCAEIKLTDISVVLDKLIKSPDGTRVDLPNRKPR